VTDESTELSDVSWDQIHARADRLVAKIDSLIANIKRMDENLSADFLALEQKIDRAAAETQAMMMFYFDDLNTRIGALENQDRARETAT
jgi:hypothetical protein